MKVFLSNRFYYLAIGITVLFVVGYYFPIVFIVNRIVFFTFVILAALDTYLLFYSGGTIDVKRTLSDRLSNGDENEVTLNISSSYKTSIEVKVLEELPEQLQIRDFVIPKSLRSGESLEVAYSVFPKSRGVYQFGHANALVTSKLGLIIRRIKTAEPEEISVYPSFIHINNIELAAISNQLTKQGQKIVRKVGNSQEFDSIRPYVLGDDPRRINWKATAKRSALQINHYIDEKSQGMYCLLDKSRSMKMPFNGLSLLDYAINASLVLSHVALKKGDQAGLISFEDNPSTFVKANTQNNQINHIIEALYREETSFNEVDFSSLYTFIRGKISQRSLLLLFTNFESIHSLERQLPHLRLLNRRHLLLVIFFKNTEVSTVIDEQAKTTESIYAQTIAMQMMAEKELINQKLKSAGILTLYTSPKHLSADVINKYIEIKNRRVL
ncbi:MAG: DUF58 domain-containing protein [Cyclobacteriaceae bacterium]